MPSYAKESVVSRARAGFWRRLVALLLDFLIIAAPFQVAVMALFPVTGGMVQMDGGVSFIQCRDSATLPTGLSPAPPEGSNYARMCRNSLAGYTKALTVTVGRQSREGATTTNVFRTYRADTNGKVVEAFAVDWVAELALLAYLIACVAKAGGTLGMKALRMEVVEAATGRKPSWGRAVLRYLFQAAGLLPLLITLLYGFVTGANFAAGPGGALFGLLAVAGVLAFAWGLINLVLVACKRDPLYDTWAGASLVRMA